MKKIICLSILISFLSCKKAGEVSIEDSHQKYMATISVNAYDLILKYAENEIMADDLYKDKLIKVNGPISKIEREGFDETICVSLAGFNDPYTNGNVKCYFSENEKVTISNLTINQMVTITGIYDSNSYSIVSLKECSFAR